MSEVKSSAPIRTILRERSERASERASGRAGGGRQRERAFGGSEHGQIGIGRVRMRKNMKPKKQKKKIAISFRAVLEI